MEITDLLVKASHLMGLGMLVVFVFLGILVFCTKLMSSMVQKFQTNVDQSATDTPLPVAQGNVSPQTVAAISAAIHQYRQSKK